MSANNSTPSQSSESRSNDDDLTSGPDLSFDGADDLLRAWCRGIRPDPNLTVSEWADQHRFLSSRASVEPGRYRTARTPYLRAIMDALSPNHPAQRICFMKAAQVGATEAGNNWIGFIIHHAPGPMLAVLPTVEMATGDITFLTVKAGEKLVEVKAGRDYRAELNSTANVGFDPGRIYLFDTGSGERLR